MNYWLAAKSEFNRLLPGVTDNFMADATHFRLGWIYLNLKEFDKALSEFRIVPNAQNISYFRYMEAECLRRQRIDNPEKLNQAIMLFHNISSVDLQSSLAPLAKLKAALTELQKGNRASALVSLRQFINLYPKDELIPAVFFLLGANESENASQRYFDQIVQQNRNSDVFNVAYFAMQNQDFRKGRYQRLITRNVSLPQPENGGELDYWQRANHLLLGESAYFLKHYHQAYKEFGLVAANMTDDLAQKASIDKAWCKLQLAGPDSALIVFEDIRSNVRGVNKILADYGYATVQFLRQDYEQALTSYPAVVNQQEHPELSPVVLKSLYRSAECYFRLEYYMQAIETWDKLAQKYPDNELAVESLFNIADVYFRANHFKEADSVYQVLMNRYPNHLLAAESALKQAQSAYNAGEYEVAITHYQSFIENYPQHHKNKDALEGIQLSYYQIGQIDQASEALKKVIEQTTNSDLAVDARFRIAVNYFEEQKYQQAVEAFKEILTLYPNSSYAVDAQFSLCKCYIAQENYQVASEELLRFTQYFPQSAQLAEAYFLLGVSYYQLESNLSAVDYFGKVIQEFSDSEYFGPALKNSGWCYDRLQDTQKALQFFSRYLENFPSGEDHYHIQLQVARLLLESGNSQTALAKFQALQKVPDSEISAEASYRLGMHYLSKDQLKKAKNVFQTAANGNGGDNYYRLSAMAQLAAIYENLGESNKAITTYKLLASSTTEERWTAAANERINALLQQTNSLTE
jgi:TolA-binding protein